MNPKEDIHTHNLHIHITLVATKETLKISYKENNTKAAGRGGGRHIYK